jgi:hypothetical protein
VALNIGPRGKLVGIEILDTRQILGPGEIPELAVGNLKPISYQKPNCPPMNTDKHR